MAVEPQNLIQIQSHLQDPAVRNEDLIKYANGMHPEVPPFLALIEMNRRKQITSTADAFNQSNKASVKDQVTSALANNTHLGGNLTANPFTMNMGNAPTGINPAAAPAGQDMTQEPTGIVPSAKPALPSTAPIKPITGAAGGLMSLPVDHFKPQSYAGGGIVAFSAGDLVNEEKKLSSFPEERDAGKKTLSDDEIERSLRGIQSVAEPAVQAKSQLPGSYQAIMAGLPGLQAPVEKTAEQLFAEKKARDKMAGVSEDPYADVKAREAAREARQAKNYEQHGMDRLLAQLGAFATADPARGIGYAGAVSADASAKLEEKQNALRDKEEAAQIEFARAMAKEEDARRRGDSEGIKAALDAQQKAKLDFQKAEHDRGMLGAHIFQTEEYAKARKQAASEAAANKPNPDDVLFNRIMAKAETDPTIKMLTKKQEMLDVGSDEYNHLEREKYRILKEKYFAQRPDLMPAEPSAASQYNPPAKPGFWESLFGGSGKPKTVSFDELPQ